ncbi:MAG TPA: glycosyltransferase [Streptosporangiaceae bacterium]
MSPNDTYPQHVVTAVLVAHDGAAWLPHVIDGLLEQTRPVQRVVAVDTGSRDRSGAVLAAKLGQQVVFGMDRTTGYGAAVARALQHKAANTPVASRAAQGRGEHGRGEYGRDQGRGEPVEWIWLLHDDCEPAADALEQLLRGAAETPAAAVLGPKVMDWSDRDVILEAGVTIDTAGRRITGIEPREVDQGQHDGDRDTLAVGSAGMLIRRDVWDQVRGFDTSMGLFREDVDLCWRVHAAGYRVRVVTDAVVFHAQAVSRRRRAVSVGRRAALLDRRNALLTLAGNLPGRPMLVSLIGNITVSLLRALFFLVAKRVTAALDETAAVVSVLCHPLRLLRVRRMRARGRRAAYGRLRADLPPGRSVRRLVEFAVSMTSSAQQDTAGSHHATEDPDEADFLLTDSGLVQRVLTSPVVLLLLALLIVTGVAERKLLGAGSLGGGALLPATTGASGLWHQYVQAFHPSGVGSPSTAPPYLAVVAALATVLAGKAWLAVDVLLLGSVPIAGMAAYLAVRRVTASTPVRVWAAATYALIPVAAGAISAGRLGTAAAFAIIPVIGLLAGRMFSQPPRIARRAAWATGLAIALGAAFVPLLWLLAVLAAIPAAFALRRSRPAILINIGIVVLVPPVLLIPWSIQLATHPAAMLLEVGTQQPGLASPGLPARSAMLLSPGGPGLPPAWVTGGLILAALLALLATRRRLLVLCGWTVAVLALLAAVLISHLSVRPVAGGPPVLAWPGAALAVAAAGLLLAAAAGGDSLGGLLAAGRTGLRRLTSGRGLAACAVALAACSAPALAAGFWLLHGISGPVGPDDGQVVPALVSVSATGGAQARTLVLSVSGSRLSYQLLRGSGPTLGDSDLTPAPAAATGLGTAVAALVAPAGGQAVRQSQLLADYDIGFVLVRAPVSLGLARALDGVPGLRAVSMTASFGLWRLTQFPSRASVTEPGGTVVPLSSGPVSVAGVQAPAAGGILTLAEPAGDWKATLNGRPLTALASPAGSWAQAFRLPPGGGTLEVTSGGLTHDVGIAIELIAVLVVAALGLPGVRAAETAAGAAARTGRAAGHAAPPARGAPPADLGGSGVAGGGTPGSGAPDDLRLAGAAAAVAGAAADGALARETAGSRPGRSASRAASRERYPDGAGGSVGHGSPDGPARARGKGTGRLGRRSTPAVPAEPGSGRAPAAGRGGRARGRNRVAPAAADAATAAWPAAAAGAGAGDIETHGTRSGGEQERAGRGSGRRGGFGRGRGNAGRGNAGRDDAGRDDAGRDDAGRDDAGRARGGRPGAAEAEPGYEGAGRGRAAGRDAAAYETASYDTASYDSARYDSAGYGGPGSAGAGPDRARRDDARRGDTGYDRPGDPGYGRPGYDRPAPGDAGASPSGPRSDTGARSPTGAWPYPDDTELTGRSPAGGPRDGDLAAPPPRPRPYAPDPSRPPAAAGPYPGRPAGNWPPASSPEPPYGAPPRRDPGPPGPDYPDRLMPERGRPLAGRADQDWPGRGAPGQAGPGPAGPGQGRPDPSWQEARRRPENRPPDRPAGGSGRGGHPEPPPSWPEGEPQSWPSQQSSSWSTGGHQSSWSGQEQHGDRSGGQRARPGSQGDAGERDYPDSAAYGGWSGPADSLEPLPPSAEVHHNGPPRGQGDRSRRRWPAPEQDDLEERDAW